MPDLAVRADGWLRIPQVHETVQQQVPRKVLEVAGRRGNRIGLRATDSTRVYYVLKVDAEIEVEGGPAEYVEVEDAIDPVVKELVVVADAAGYAVSGLRGEW